MRWCLKCNSGRLSRIYFRKDLLKCPKCGMALPPETDEDWRRRSWKEEQEMEKKEHDANPLLAYSYRILRKTPTYEISFEKHQKDSKDSTKSGREDVNNFIAEMFARENENSIARQIREGKIKPPNGMTKTQWLKEHSKKRREEREEQKQETADWNLYLNSPINMLSDMFRGIDSECECEAEEMRTGKFCKVCILAGVIRQKTLDIFKDAAEGRSPYV